MKNSINYFIRQGLAKHKLIVILIVLLNPLISFASIVQPLVFRDLFDNALPNENLQRAIILIIIMILTPILTSFLNGLNSFNNNRLGVILSQLVRKELFQRILKANHTQLQKIGNGEIINRISQQTGMLCEVFVVNNLMKAVTELTLLIVTLLIMSTFSFQLTIVTILFFPIFFLIVLLLQKKAQSLQGEMFSDIEKKLNYLQDFFNNFKAIRVFNGQEKETRNWEKWLEGNWKTRYKATVFFDVFNNVLTEIIMSLMTGIVYAYSFFLVIRGDLTLGELLAFIVLLPRIYTILQDFFFNGIEFAGIREISANLNEILNIELVPDGKLSLDKNMNYNLKLDAVNFRYSDNEDIGISNICLNINYGEFIGIVGVSGSGKSTIFELIHRHFEPESGYLFLNDQHISAYSLKSLRNYIGYNPQNLGLWNLSLLENIIYPLDKEDLTDEDRKRFDEIVAMTFIDVFAENLPDKYETVIKDNGSNFSGGEIQRILLARTLFQQPKILLLDEYSSALDAITEQALKNTFNQISQKLTVIVVAHRLSTVIDADRIVVVNNGRIVEEGTKDELLDIEGIFYQMYQSQKI